MGPIDFLKEFEGRVLDAASFQRLKRNYELQEDNNNQFKNKVGHLESENVTLQDKLDKAIEENKELEEKLFNLAKKTSLPFTKALPSNVEKMVNLNLPAIVPIATPL